MTGQVSMSKALKCSGIVGQPRARALRHLTSDTSELVYRHDFQEFVAMRKESLARDGTHYQCCLGKDSKAVFSFTPEEKPELKSPA